MPSVTTLLFRSTWHEMGDFISTLAIVHFYRNPQLGVFVGCSVTGTSIRLGNAGIQGITPSADTLTSRSTRARALRLHSNFLPSCNCTASVSLVSYVRCPSTCTYRRGGRCWNTTFGPGLARQLQSNLCCAPCLISSCCYS
jgi:hypothetical protein